MMKITETAAKTAKKAKKAPANKAAKPKAKKAASKSTTKAPAKAKSKATAPAAPGKKVSKKAAAPAVSPARQEQIDRAKAAGVLLTETDLKNTTPALKGIVTKKIKAAEDAAAQAETETKAPAYLAIIMETAKKDEPMRGRFTRPYQDAKLDAVVPMPTEQDIERLSANAFSSLPEAAQTSRFVMLIKPRNRSVPTLPLIKAPESFRVNSSVGVLTQKVKSDLITALSDPTKAPLKFTKTFLVDLFRKAHVTRGSKLHFADGFKIGLPVHGPVNVFPITISSTHWTTSPHGLETTDGSSSLPTWQVFEHLTKMPTPLATQGMMVSLRGLSSHYPLVDKLVKISAADGMDKNLAFKVATFCQEVNRALTAARFKTEDHLFKWAEGADVNQLDGLAQVSNKMLADASRLVLDRPVGVSQQPLTDKLGRNLDHWTRVFAQIIEEALTPKTPEPIIDTLPSVDPAGVPLTAPDKPTKKVDPLRPNSVRMTQTSVPVVPKNKAAQASFIADRG